jgi:hypothetical protein
MLILLADAHGNVPVDHAGNFGRRKQNVRTAAPLINISRFAVVALAVGGQGHEGTELAASEKL